MNNGLKSLPKDVKSLTNLVLELRLQVELQHAQLEQKSNYIDQLVEVIALARQQFFGSRNQKIETDSTQLPWLFNEAETIADHELDNSDQDDGKTGTGNNNTSPRKRSKGGQAAADPWQHGQPRCHCLCVG